MTKARGTLRKLIAMISSVVLTLVAFLLALLICIPASFIMTMMGMYDEDVKDMSMLPIDFIHGLIINLFLWAEALD